MSTAVLAIISAILAAVMQFLPQIPELIALVENAAELLGQTTPITAAQEATLWANLTSAHNALQAAGGPNANVLAPAVAMAPGT